MKHFLLTWYGITDLRAALGQEATDGPVLSALKTGDYTDAVILAYTDPGKPLPTEGQQDLDSVVNTPLAHALFASWLEKSLAEAGVSVRTQVAPQDLAHLNDAVGILRAASGAVRLALADKEDKQVTTYVSPGTPVMAYTWALIARSNPQLRLRVISSSDSRRPPEAIELPTSLLNPSIADPVGAQMSAREYDLVIHLLGEQVTPVLFALRQFTAARNLVLTTREYVDQVESLAKVTAVEPVPVVIADPFEPIDTKKAIESVVASMPSNARIAVNMTGGTKLMFAGALNACWELGLDPFYFEIKNHNVIFLRDGTQAPFVGISNVEDFLTAEGFHALRPSKWPTNSDDPRNRRAPVAAEVWRRRATLRSLYKDRQFLEFSHRYDSHYPYRERDSLPFSLSWRGGLASLNEGGTPKLVLDGTELAIPKRGLFPFLAGGWLEEYAYSLLRPLLEEGLIRDIRVGLEIGHGPTSQSASKPAKSIQEFDCVFTDGKRLWIVECKAGPVKQDAIQKLENIVRQYGGVAARGLLVSSFPVTDAIQERVDLISSITAVRPDHLTTEMLRLIIRTA